MLVFVSDIHLNDGTVCKHTDGDAAKAFFSRLKDQIYSAGFRSDGSYRPVTTVSVVMLGDVFDFIRSSKWHYSNTSQVQSRPWHDVKEWHYIAKEICSDIIKENADFLDTFRKASLFGLDIKVPDTYSPGYEKLFGTGIVNFPNELTHTRCSVELYYMVGNHDWILRNPDSRLDEVRYMVKSSLGLLNRDFVWDIKEISKTATELLDLSKEHRVYFQHGDSYDPYNYHPFLGRDASSVGDAIVIELVTGFPVKVRRELAKQYSDYKMSKVLDNALQEIDNIRPATQVPVYIRHIMDEYAPDKYERVIRKIFTTCINNLVKSDIVKQVSKYDKWLKFKISFLGFVSKYLPISALRMIANLSSLIPDDYIKAASKEIGLMHNSYDYVVYGHTHQSSVPIGIGMKENNPKVYINSSTWRPVHSEITEGELDKGIPYLSYQTIGWVTFYNDDERRGRRYEVWTGDMEISHDPI